MSQETQKVLVIAFVVGLNIIVGLISIEIAGRHLWCAWCTRPYAYWKRHGSRCCWKHRQEGRRLAKMLRRDRRGQISRPYTPKHGRTERKSIRPIGRASR